jgi:TPR repeat protein
VHLGNKALNDASKKGANTKELVDKAMQLFRQSGEAGFRVGWFNLGQLLWSGYPAISMEDPLDATSTTDGQVEDQILKPDLHQAMEAFTNAIDLGDTDAMYLVGVHRMSNGGKEGVFSGYKLIEKASKQGHGGALYYVALLKLNGESHLNFDPCSLEEFTEHLDKAVDAGDLDARFTRGHSYYHGTEGYVQSFENALKDFLLTANEGHADAAVSAGAMLHDGVGAAKDQRKAFELYQRAGEMGSKEGWQNVVSCYTTGEGVPQSLETAKHIRQTMLKEATNQGDR